MMEPDEPAAGGDSQAPGGQGSGEGAEPAAPAPQPPPRPTVIRTGGGAGRRLLAAAVLAPWIIGYGITGSWAVTRGARALAQHLAQVDAGYSHPVSPGGLIVVGALLLAAFAVLLATAVLLLLTSARRGTWTAVLIVTLVLLAGAVWAGIAGHISPGLWLLLFFGLLFCAIVDALVLWRVPRRPGRATIAAP